MFFYLTIIIKVTGIPKVLSKSRGKFSLYNKFEKETKKSSINLTKGEWETKVAKFDKRKIA
jgi:hypothetical protein